MAYSEGNVGKKARKYVVFQALLSNVARRQPVNVLVDIPRRQLWMLLLDWRIHPA
ncbi:MAG: hypothetical protein ACYCZD_06110 [Rhodanobacter sp.]